MKYPPRAQALHDDAAAARTAALELADLGHEMATVELAGLHAEKKLTQKFRSPQSLAILGAAYQLLRDVDAAVKPSALVPPDWLEELHAAIDEVTPMAGAADGGDDELDDEI